MTKSKEKKLLISNLISLDKNQLADLFTRIISEHPKTLQTFLEWMKKNDKNLTFKKGLNVNTELLWEYWQEAQDIISDFNEYGGGSEDDEDIVYDLINNLIDLFNTEEFSSEIKIEILESIFNEYVVHNSGFDDILIDLCNTICKTKTEWQYLAKKLLDSNNSYDLELAMNIYKKHLKDEQTYLALRSKKLVYGFDYWDLAEFYVDNNDILKAVETAHNGLNNGKGNREPLYNYLIKYYTDIADSNNIENLIDIAKSKKDFDLKIIDPIFQYYKNQNNYHKAKTILLESFNHVEGIGYIENVRPYKYYNIAKEFLSSDDWNSIEPSILNKIKKKDEESYMKICYEKHDYAEILDILQISLKKNVYDSFISSSSFESAYDKFAVMLANIYPQEIIEFLWTKAEAKILNGSRKTYCDASFYIYKVKCVFLDILKNPNEWELKLCDIKERYKKRKAFIEELNNYLNSAKY